MEEERHYNEIAAGGNVRSRAVSSPIPYNPSPSSSRPLSPGGEYLYNYLLYILKKICD